MRFDEKAIHKIIEENKEYFDALEHYDRTRELDIGRARLYVTLSKKLLRKLQELRKKTGKPISRIIEEALS
jgi:hypothetical protein